MSEPNGTPLGIDEWETVVGINFGNSYASIAIITKEGKPECIANEEGERQIAAAISFHGEETYIGNQATPQLVKNSANTIINFRNLLGKKFSEIPASALKSHLVPSASLIEHPSIPDTPCYAVEVLVPAPTPLPRSTIPTPTLPPSSRPSTQYPTPIPTPRSEPTVQTRYVTPHDAAVILLRSLHQSAGDFLGKVPRGVVLTVPSSFDDTQRAALTEAAKEAGINVLQLLEEDAAAASLLIDEDNPANTNQSTDRTTLLVDWGSTNLTLSLLSIKAGLAHVLGSKSIPELGTSCPGSIDEALVKYFAKEFSKKTGEAIQVCPADNSSIRAQTRLFLALPHVKRSLTSVTTSSKAAQISVESLHNGLDFSSALNRTRASGLFVPVFDKFSAAVKSLLESTEGWHDKGVWIDSIAWLGGGGCIGFGAGAASTLLSSNLIGEDTKDEVVGAPEEALARGCALHARNIVDLDENLNVNAQDVKVTHRTIGILIPGSEENKDEFGGQWLPIISSETPLPACRTVVFGALLAEGATVTTVPLEVWEASENLRVRVIPAEAYSDAEEDEEPPEPTEERERGIKKEAYLGALEIPISPPTNSDKKGKKVEKKIEFRVNVDLNGAVEAAARERGAEWVKLALAAPSS